MSPRTADTTVGQVAAVRATDPTTRRGTPWQERSPFVLWPTVSAATAALSPGHPPANPRLAISTREHQTGGAPIRSAWTRRGHRPRPPPHPRANEHSQPRRHIIRSWLPASRTPPASLRDRLRRSLTRPPIRGPGAYPEQGAHRAALKTIHKRPETGIPPQCRIHT